MKPKFQTAMMALAALLHELGLAWSLSYLITGYQNGDTQAAITSLPTVSRVLLNLAAQS